eukprot:TRINITY_DN66186_c3_g1_i1.p1 TRINITY_DN66186_c3_g1~~TRINITY_DN66186_c3_g1_i1.p1  ORF type:complete len:371 (+),score=100.06 TRINITY_DN66186_c3_g1_i1:34-1146(+)
MEIPPSLREISTYIQRANEFAARNPAVAYYAKLYAAQLVMKKRDPNDPQQTEYLKVLMTELEELNSKVTIGKEEAKDLINSYALQLFKKADDQERKLNVSQVTVRLFYVSTVLMEITKQFGELDEDIAEKQKYAKWKAAEIKRSLESGQPYTRPDDDAEEEEEQPDEGATAQPGGTATPGNTGPPPGVYTPIVPDNSQPPPQNRGLDMGGMGGPPTGFQQPPPQQQYMPANPMPSNNPPPPATGMNAPPPAAFQQQFQPPPQQQQPPPQPAYTPPPVQPTPPPQQQPPPQQYQPPPQATTQMTPPPQQRSAPPPSATVSHGVASRHGEVSYKTIMEAQKYSKFAVSSLQFNDVNSAIENLHKALNLLEGR